MASREIINKIFLYIEKLTDAGIPVEKAYLYGSYARGDQNQESDIDLMIVSKVFDKKDNDFSVGLAWKLTRMVDTRIEPYTVGLERFNTDNISPLLQIVKKEGIAIEK